MIVTRLEVGDPKIHNLTLRPSEPKDAAQAVEWLNEPVSAALFLMDWKPTAEQYAEMIRLSPETEGKYSWMIYLGDEHVGLLTVRGVNTDIGVGEPLIMIGPAYRGRGIATAALRAVGTYMFHDRRIALLHVTVRKDNLASIRVMEKVGFKEWEGSPALFARYEETYVEVWEGYLPR